MSECRLQPVSSYYCVTKALISSDLFKLDRNTIVKKIQIDDNLIFETLN